MSFLASLTAAVLRCFEINSHLGWPVFENGEVLMLA